MLNSTAATIYHRANAQLNEANRELTRYTETGEEGNAAWAAGKVAGLSPVVRELRERLEIERVSIATAAIVGAGR